MIFFKALTYFAGLLTLGLFGYLYKVLDDTGYLEQVMAMPKDDILIFHVIAGIVIAWLLFSMVMKVISRGLLVVLLVLAVGAEGIFVGLNINGNIIEKTDYLEELQDKAQDLLDQAKDKAEDLLDN